jgi:hypothetical protein
MSSTKPATFTTNIKNDLFGKGVGLFVRPWLANKSTPHRKGAPGRAERDDSDEPIRRRRESGAQARSLTGVPLAWRASRQRSRPEPTSGGEMKTMCSS